MTRRPGLSEDIIVEAAKGLLAEHGVDGLTMRALSERLGVALGATYRHVPNKHALLQLVARSLYDDISHVEDEPDPLARVKAVMLEVRRMFARLPGNGRLRQRPHVRLRVTGGDHHAGRAPPGVRTAAQRGRGAGPRPGALHSRGPPGQGRSRRRRLRPKRPTSTASICSWPAHSRSPVNTVDRSSGPSGTVPQAATSLTRITNQGGPSWLTHSRRSSAPVTPSPTRHFGAPYIDVDEWRDKPYPHRHVHGGFADCDTRFTFYFPAHEEWQGRMIMPLEGAHAGHEDAFGGAMGDADRRPRP